MNVQNRKPFFSIIIPTYNEEKFLPNLLESLTTQTDTDFEVIVVDGMSKDKTVEKAKTFASKLASLSVVVSDKASLPYQRNYGAKYAKGTWFLFIDADSIFLPYCLERCREFIRKEKPTFFTTWFMPDSMHSGDAMLVLLSNIFVEAGKIVKRQIAPGPFAGVLRTVFKESNGYDESRGYGEDQEYSMRLFELGHHIKILRETLYVYSLRRFRNQGTMKVIHTYVVGAFITLLTRRAPKNISGYIMGGHLYGKPKPVKQSVLERSEEKLRNFIKEVFS